MNTFESLSVNIPQLPLSYGISHDWGTILLTEDAQKSYELLPLSAAAVKLGGLTTQAAIDSDRLPDNRLKIYITSSEEVGLDPSQTTTLNTAIAIKTVKDSPNDLTLLVAPSQNRQAFADSRLQMMLREVQRRGTETADMDTETFTSQFEGPNGESLRDYVAVEYTAEIVHGMQKAVTKGLGAYAMTVSENSYNRHFLQQIRDALALTTGTATAEGVFVGNLPVSHNVLAGFAVSGTMMALGSIGVYGHIKRYVEGRHRWVMTNGIAAEQQASQVAQSLHDDFCSLAFDAYLARTIEQSD